MMSADEQRLHELVSRLCEDATSDAEFCELEAMLAADPRSRRRYLEYLLLHGELLWSQGNGETIPLAGIQTEAARRGPATGNAARSGARRAVKFFARPTPLSISVAALVIGLFITAMAFIAAPVYRHLAVVRDESAMRQDSHPVAQLTGVHGARWAEGQIGAFRGAHLVAGHRMKLKQGLAEVAFNDGAVALLEGPCDFVVSSSGSGNLVRGKLAARVGNRARGFTILTPAAEIVDLGTEFGASVDDQGATEARVFSGSIEMRSLASSGSVRRLAAGAAARVAAGGDRIILSENPTEYARVLPRPAAASTLPEPKGRSIAIVNHSFELPAIDDGRVGRHKADGNFADWRTPVGWRWTNRVPEFGGLGNPASVGIGLVYSGTDGDGGNGAMAGSQVVFFGVGVGVGQGIEQTLNERFAADRAYELRVAAGVRAKYSRVDGEIRLLAGDNLLVSRSLPADAGDRFRDYSVVYRFDPAHRSWAGLPLKIQLLGGQKTGLVDYDNVRLYVLVDD